MKREQIKEILIRARKRISNGENWTTGTPARDKAGCSIDLSSKDAFSWCLVGAIRRESSNSVEYQNVIRQLYEVRLDLVEINLVMFNDNSKHEEVLEFLDKAIKTI